MAETPEILTSARFYLELEGSEGADAMFMDCKGFKSTQEVVEACEVTPQTWGTDNTSKVGRVVRTKIPGNVKTNTIVLRRGLTNSQKLWSWFNAVQSGNWGKNRKSGSITIYDQSGKAQARFQFENAWPSNYTLTDFSASSADYEIEELELVCETFKRDDKP